MKRTMWGSMALCGLIMVGLITLPSYADESATPDNSIQGRGLPSFSPPPPPPPPPAPPAPPALPSSSSQAPAAPPLPTFPIEIQTSGDGSVSYQIYNLDQCGGAPCQGSPVHAHMCPPVCRWVPVAGWYGWIDMQALAAPGSSFKVWGGKCAAAGQTPYCRLYMDRQQTVQATFQKTPVSSSRKQSASQPHRAR